MEELIGGESIMRKHKKGTLTLAEYRKRKRNRKSITGLASAVAAMAICASRMASAFGRMGSAALQVGGFYNPNPGNTRPLDELVVDTKALVDRIRNIAKVTKVDVSMKDLLAEKMNLIAKKDYERRNENL